MIPPGRSLSSGSPSQPCAPGPTSGPLPSRALASRAILSNRLPSVESFQIPGHKNKFVSRTFSLPSKNTMPFQHVPYMNPGCSLRVPGMFSHVYSAQVAANAGLSRNPPLPPPLAIYGGYWSYPGPPTFRRLVDVCGFFIIISNNYPINP